MPHTHTHRTVGTLYRINKCDISVVDILPVGARLAKGSQNVYYTFNLRSIITDNGNDIIIIISYYYHYSYYYY